MVSAEGGYRTSHAYEGKGVEYDADYATRYRVYQWEREQAVIKKIIARHVPKGPIRCLDFACGTGRILRFLETLIDQPTGVDISEDMLRQAKSKVTTSRLVHGDVTREKLFGDEKFNLITAFRFFLNAEQELRAEALAALTELLTDDGILIFNNHLNHTSLGGCLARIHKRVRGGNAITWRIRDMYSLVESAGLEVAGIYHEGVIPGWRRYMLLPNSCYHFLDGLASRIGPFRHVALDILMACRKKAPQQS